MRNSDVGASAAKIELALKTYKTTFGAVDPQWTDAARYDFEKTYLTAVEPNARSMLEAISRLASVLAAAERQCNSD